MCSPIRKIGDVVMTRDRRADSGEGMLRDVGVRRKGGFKEKTEANDGSQYRLRSR